MVKKIQDREGEDLQAGDVVKSKYTGIDYIIVEEDGKMVGMDSRGKGRKIDEIQISECKKIGKFNPGKPAEDKEPFDVIQHLKAKATSLDKRVKMHDSFIQHHSGSRSKTPKSELDRHEKERDWDADARDQILTAVQILEDVL